MCSNAHLMRFHRGRTSSASDKDVSAGLECCKQRGSENLGLLLCFPSRELVDSVWHDIPLKR